MIKVVCIGKKHEKWISSGIEMYQERLKQPWNINWDLLPHSNFSEDRARAEESERILKRIKPDDFVVLLDERGKNISSIDLAGIFEDKFNFSREIVVIVGGAYGVDQTIFNRANFIWSLSKLVFPHQMVRLILTEQIYRAQEISSGGKYHHI